jgi:hypothetical protein
MSTRFRDIARRVHRNVEIALYATLFAFVIFLTIFILPKLPEIQKQYAIVQIQQISAENSGLCEKLSFKHGSDRYNQCLLHVGDFRGKVEKRAFDEISPW